MRPHSWPPSLAGLLRSLGSGTRFSPVDVCVTGLWATQPSLACWDLCVICIPRKPLPGGAASNVPLCALRCPVWWLQGMDTAQWAQLPREAHPATSWWNAHRNTSDLQASLAVWGLTELWSRPSHRAGVAAGLCRPRRSLLQPCWSSLPAHRTAPALMARVRGESRAVGALGQERSSWEHTGVARSGSAQALQEAVGSGDLPGPSLHWCHPASWGHWGKLI